MNPVSYKWHFRYRTRDEGQGSWGVVDTGVLGDSVPVLDWSVSRSRNQPATAQIVIDPHSLDDEYLRAVRGMLMDGKWRQRKWGLSLFRDDFPEANSEEPVFFGVVRTVDAPSNGPITIQAEDMMSVMKEIVVGDYDTQGNELNPGVILGGMCGAWTDKYPESTGLTFRSEGVHDRNVKVEAKDLKTLFDVAQDLCNEGGIEMYYDAGVNIFMRYATDDWSYPVPQHLLDGTSLSRLIGPESEATIVVACGEEEHPNDDPDPKEREKNPTKKVNVVQRVVTPVEAWQFHQAFPYSIRTEGKPGTVAAVATNILRQVNRPALNISMQALWEEGKPFPRPGMMMEGECPSPLPGSSWPERRTVRFRGRIESVNITPETVTIDLTSMLALNE